MHIPRFIAHRGFSSQAPENTVAAFEHAEKAGYHMFECDVQLTRDNIPVIIHDEKLDRTTNGRGRVRQTLYHSIQTLDAGSWFAPEFAGERIPCLQVLLAWVAEHKIALNLELKGIDGEEAENQKLAEIVAERVKPYQEILKNRILISSFQHEALQRFKKTCPALPLGVLVSPLKFKSVGFMGLEEQFKALGAFTVNPALKLMTRKNIPQFLAISPHLLVYTVAPQDAESLFKQGITAVFTNG